MDTLGGSRFRIWSRVVSILLLAMTATPFLAGPGIEPALAQGNAPALEIVSPSNGASITSDDISVQVKVTNFTIDCRQAGRPNRPDVGHIHLMIDGMSMAQLANFYCTDSFTVSGAGLTPGKHKLLIDLADNNHVDMMATMKEVEVDYQPAHPRPLPKSDFTGTPGVELVSPANGATVAATFEVTVKPVNFHPDPALEGKPNVPGYGHYHVFIDTPMGSMGMMGMMGTPEAGMTGTPMTGMAGGHMAMAGMVLMPGTDSFQLDLTAWGKGEHTIWIEPVQNDHTQYEQFGHVEFKVNVQ